MSVTITSLFWVTVIRAGPSRKPVGMLQLLPWIVTCAVVMILLEFLDGILYFTSVNINEDLFNSIAFSVFAAVCALDAMLILWSGTFLLRKVRFGDRLKQASTTKGRTRFSTSIGHFVLSELVCTAVLIMWFLVAAWVGPLITYDNISWWIMFTVFYLALLYASFSVIVVFHRSPKVADVPTFKESETRNQPATAETPSHNSHNSHQSEAVSSATSDVEMGNVISSGTITL